MSAHQVHGHIPDDRLSYHGGVDRCELEHLGVDPDSAIDFSSNILDVRQPSAVTQALRNADTANYPDRSYRDLRRAIANRHEIDVSRVWAGNGASDLIHLVARGPLQSNNTFILGPTFSEYERATRLAGGRVTTLWADENDGFRHQPDHISRALQNERPGAVWICNPNNPTGQAIDPIVVKQWMREHPKTLFVIDESYHPFANNVESLVSDPVDNLLVIRSMTKAFAIAGVRLGYVVGHPERIAELRNRSVPWSVSSVASAAGVAALRYQDHFRNAIEQMRQRRDELVGQLRQRGHAPVSTETNYFLLAVDDAKIFRRTLIDAGVIVRDGTSFGLPRHVRIAVRDRHSNNTLLGVIDRLAERPVEVEPLVASIPSFESDVRVSLTMSERGPL